MFVMRIWRCTVIFLKHSVGTYVNSYIKINEPATVKLRHNHLSSVISEHWCCVVLLKLFSWVVEFSAPDRDRSNITGYFKCRKMTSKCKTIYRHFKERHLKPQTEQRKWQPRQRLNKVTCLDKKKNNALTFKTLHSFTESVKRHTTQRSLSPRTGSESFNML